jgi:hypothetical protein
MATASSTNSLLRRRSPCPRVRAVYFHGSAACCLTSCQVFRHDKGWIPTQQNPAPTPAQIRDGQAHTYSRMTTPTATQLEKVLSKINVGSSLFDPSRVCINRVVCRADMPLPTHPAWQRRLP